jgi:hypothetical protein
VRPARGVGEDRFDRQGDARPGDPVCAVSGWTVTLAGYGRWRPPELSKTVSATSPARYHRIKTRRAAMPSDDRHRL